MIGYLFLGIALLCGAVKGYCGKKTSGFLRTPADSVLISLLRMAMCIFIGIAAILFDKTAVWQLPTDALLVSLASGITCSAFVITWILCIRTGAFMMVDVFLTAGVVIPIVSCALMYGETVSVRQIIGCALLLVAVLIMCSYNNSVKKVKITLPALALLILCGVANGCTDLLQKVYVKMTDNGSAATFNFYSYIGATVSLGIVYLGIMLYNKKKKAKAAELGEAVVAESKFKLPKLLPYIVVMAICLFFYSFFKTLAATRLDSILLYPISQVGSMLLASLMAMIFFKEKMNWKGVLGIVIALCAMLLINL